MIKKALLATAALAAAADPHPCAIADQPAWSDVASPLYVVLRNQYGGDDAQWQGIWRFDPGSSAFVRLRSWWFNSDWLNLGNGSYLSAIEDRVLFEGWPVDVQIDPVSGRMVVRSDATLGPREGGWFAQGPVVGQAFAAATGLAQGIYGTPRCWYFTHQVISEPQGCDPFTAPPGIDSLIHPALQFVFRTTEPGVEHYSLFADLTPLPDESGYISTSTDTGRQGLWVAKGYSLSFIPVRNGALDLAAATSRGFPAEILPEQTWMQQFFYSARRDRFFGVSFGWSYPFPRTFMALRPDLTVERVYGHDTQTERYPGPRDPMPWTFAELPAQPPETHTQTVPIVAHAPGRSGTFWVSDLWLFNPSGMATTVRVSRVSAPGVETELEMGAHASFHVADALSWAGGGANGDGTTHDALIVTSPYRWGEQLVAASRTYTAAQDPGLEGGTYGHAVVAVPGLVGFSNHLAEISLGWNEIDSPSTFILDRREPGRYRHNLGVTNPTDRTLTLRLWGDHEEVVTVSPRSVAMVNVDAIFPSGPGLARALPVLVSADASAPVWLSTVDGLTGDATFLPVSLVEMLHVGMPHVIPAVARTLGSGASMWRSDLHLAWCWGGRTGTLFPSDPARQCGGAGAGGIPAALVPAEGCSEYVNTDTQILDDVVELFPACQGDTAVRGALEVEAGEWTTSFARTYTTRADGGTYGEMLPLYPPRGWPVQHFAGIEAGGRFRVNLGLYNGDGEHAITHRLRLYAADGTLATERDVVLQPRENDVRRLELWLGLDRDSLPAGTYGLTVLPLDDPANGVEGRSWAFVSLVDNVTNDPTNWW